MNVCIWIIFLWNLLWSVCLKVNLVCMFTCVCFRYRAFHRIFSVNGWWTRFWNLAREHKRIAIVLVYWYELRTNTHPLQNVTRATGKLDDIIHCSLFFIISFFDLKLNDPNPQFSFFTESATFPNLIGKSLFCIKQRTCPELVINSIA